MKKFLDDNFLLNNKTAETLYHGYAKSMPIIDYHCHLPQQQIAEDKNFDNLTQVWLYGDHYKWRAMRTNGVDEKYCTGNTTDYEKFEQWCRTSCVSHIEVGFDTDFPINDVKNVVLCIRNRTSYAGEIDYKATP